MPSSFFKCFIHLFGMFSLDIPFRLKGGNGQIRLRRRTHNEEMCLFRFQDGGWLSSPTGTTLKVIYRCCCCCCWVIGKDIIGD
mmetsp:Transcript_114225/g.319159  ORF Transcript_114225/g.319159 Transcript_114225/m.319159 type:complete len:83 (-) Transcript_114225:79-327(-)